MERVERVERVERAERVERGKPQAFCDLKSWNWLEHVGTVDVKPNIRPKIFGATF